MDWILFVVACCLLLLSFCGTPILIWWMFPREGKLAQTNHSLMLSIETMKEANLRLTKQVRHEVVKNGELLEALVELSEANNALSAEVKLLRLRLDTCDVYVPEMFECHECEGAIKLMADETQEVYTCVRCKNVECDECLYSYDEGFLCKSCHEEEYAKHA